MRETMVTGPIIWGKEIAEVYDKTYAAQSWRSVLGPIVDLLAEPARGGPALEFAVGTGRVALPLSARGIAMAGIELSPYMAERLRARPGAEAVPVTIEDMPATRVRGALPPGQAGWIFTLDPDHVGIDTCRRHHGPDRLVAPPDRSRRVAVAPLRAIPLRVAL
jgi:hypothetical protein